MPRGRLITEAKRELYLTAKPVKQIAFELGYKDEFYFSRFFKNITGQNISAYKKEGKYDGAVSS